MSLRTLADASGVTASIPSRIGHGKNPRSVSTPKKMLAALPPRFTRAMFPAHCTFTVWRGCTGGPETIEIRFEAIPRPTSDERHVVEATATVDRFQTESKRVKLSVARHRRRGIQLEARACAASPDFHPARSWTLAEINASQPNGGSQ
jgi:hypothetical protein